MRACACARVGVCSEYRMLCVKVAGQKCCVGVGRLPVGASGVMWCAQWSIVLVGARWCRAVVVASAVVVAELVCEVALVAALAAQDAYDEMVKEGEKEEVDQNEEEKDKDEEQKMDIEKE